MNNKLDTGIALVLVVLFLANSAYMLVAPESWYWAVDGVADTGAYNPHFIRDIGFIYLLSSAGLGAGLLWPGQRLGLWMMVAGWQVMHALFHVWEVVVGICGPEALLRDFVGVTLPALLLVMLVIRCAGQLRLASATQS